MQPHTLTSDSIDPQPRDTLLDTPGRAVVRNEFIIAHEEDDGNPYPQVPDRPRGYISVWARRTESDLYDRVQMLSGDDDWARDEFGSLAEGDTKRIERFIEGRLEVPQP